MRNNQLIVKNTIFLGLRMAIIMVIGLYTSRVVLQTLGVEDFGIYNVVCGFVMLFSFLNTSMTNAIQRFYNIEYGKKGESGFTEVYNTSLIIQALLAILIVTATETVGLWYLKNMMVMSPERAHAALWVFECSVLALVFIIMQIPFSAAVIAHERMNYFALISTLEAVLKLGLILVLPHLEGDKLILYGAILTTTSLFSLVAYIIYCKIQFKSLKREHHFNREQAREMLSFAGWNLFGSASEISKEQGINMILNLFGGPIINAARGIAYQVTSAINGFVGNISTAARPQLMQSYAAEDYERSRSIMYMTSKICFICLLLLAIPVGIEIDYILHLWLGVDVPPDTGTFVRIVLVSTLVNTLNPPVSFVVHATGQMRKYQVYTSIVMLSSLPISYVALKLGAAPVVAFYTLLGCTIVSQAVSIIILHSLFSFSYLEYGKRVLLPITIIALLAPVIPCWTMLQLEEGFARLVIVTILTILMVSMIGYLSLSQEEKTAVHTIIRKICRK